MPQGFASTMVTGFMWRMEQLDLRIRYANTMGHGGT